MIFLNWYTHTMENCSAIKGNEMSISAITWMNLKILCYTKETSPSGAVVKNPPTNARVPGDTSPLSALEDPLKQEIATHSSILCLENSMDRGAWSATVHVVTKSQTQLSTHTQRSRP